MIFATSAVVAPAQTFQPLHFFKNSDGESPCGSLVLGNDGYFYGMTANSAQNLPTIFKMTPAGNLTTVAYFNNITNGSWQNALTLGRDGAFYGTAGNGGNTNWNNGNGWGALFKFMTNGMLTTLADFDHTNGSDPENLILGTDGNFYGTTGDGGHKGQGTVFKVTAAGSLTALVSFSNVPPVVGGRHGGLTLGNDGNFYGTTGYGGGITNSHFPAGFGTIFMVTSNGTLTTLTNFNGANGADPLNALTLGNDGNFYGTTDSGGGITNSQFPTGFGTIFMVTSNGTLTMLTNFNGANGAVPAGALTQGNDGYFYGTTIYGGNTNLNDGFGCGTIFKVTTNGVLTTLFSFSETNGSLPCTALTLASDGNFYGMTEGGGPGNNGMGYGTVFCLSFKPFIVVQPQSQTNYASCTATFTVMAVSPVSLNYQWQKNGTNLSNNGKFSGATTNMLTVSNLLDEDAAAYSVVVNDGKNSVTSSVANLTIIDSLFIAVQPQSQTVSAGSNATFFVTAYGAPPFIFQWYFNGTPVGSPTTGTNVSTYTATHVGANQMGNYNVKMVNGYGSLISSNATLTVSNLPPIFTTQPTSCTNNVATAATFSVAATSVSALNYQWQQNGTNLVNGGKFSGVTNSTLTITSVSSNEAAIYAVVVTNSAGGVTSSKATLTVIYPPVIKVQPLGQYLFLGSAVLFNVAVSGTAPFNYQWRRNGNNLLNATNAIYAIQSIIAANAGNYSVVVTNSAGSMTSSNAILTVIVPPSLALQLWAGYPLLYLNGMLSNNFVVQYRTNLADTNWINLLSLSNLSSSPYLFLDPAGVVPPARFYRAFMQ